jgi:hypothetical protein
MQVAALFCATGTAGAQTGTAIVAQRVLGFGMLISFEASGTPERNENLPLS